LIHELFVIVSCTSTELAVEPSSVSFNTAYRIVTVRITEPLIVDPSDYENLLWGRRLKYRLLPCRLERVCHHTFCHKICITDFLINSDTLIPNLAQIF
jgi:hypothetical protein